MVVTNKMHWRCVTIDFYSILVVKYFDYIVLVISVCSVTVFCILAGLDCDRKLFVNYV